MSETTLILQPVAPELQDIIVAELPTGFAARFTDSAEPRELRAKLADESRYSRIPLPETDRVI